MNNEPVAWMTKWGDGTWSFQTKPREDEICIPLYTHPVKELTNAEILWLADEYSDEENLVADCVGFARAILRKAQEK